MAMIPLWIPTQTSLAPRVTLMTRILICLESKTIVLEVDTKELAMRAKETLILIPQESRRVLTTKTPTCLEFKTMVEWAEAATEAWEEWEEEWVVNAEVWATQAREIRIRIPLGLRATHTTRTLVFQEFRTMEGWEVDKEVMVEVMEAMAEEGMEEGDIDGPMDMNFKFFWIC